jgi:hypothetical protein
MSWNNIILSHLLDEKWREQIDKESRDNLSKTLPGNPLGFAESYLSKNKIEFRIVRDDEEHYAITDDLVAMRANLEVDNGFITKVTWG